MAGEEEKKEGKGFTVQDRRRFSETGTAGMTLLHLKMLATASKLKLPKIQRLSCRAKPKSRKRRSQKLIFQPLLSALAHKRSCISARLPIR